MVPDKQLTLWAWLFPITYIVHIAEEYWGGEGYLAYIRRLRGVEMSSAKFLVGQAIALALIVLGIFLSRKFDFRVQLLVILGAIVLINALSHMGTSFYYREYGPGLISGAVIWLPFGLATLIKFKSSVVAHRYWLYVGIGIAINLAIAVIALNGRHTS